jgi:cytochrome P450
MLERFEGRGNDFTSAKSGFFPFAYGSRTCIGNTLAQLESATFLVHLLKRFFIEPAPGFKPMIESGISLTTTNGINVRLVERNCACAKSQ